LLQGIGPRNKLFLMATCESGEAEEGAARIGASTGSRGLAARTLAPAATRGLALMARSADEADAEKNRYIFNDLLRRSGAIVFSSCKGNEAALEDPELKQGLFTYEILATLRDKSAAKSGLIPIDTLREKVSQGVAGLIADYNKKAEAEYTEPAKRPWYSQHPTVDRDNIFAKFGFPLVDAEAIARSSAKSQASAATPPAAPSNAQAAAPKASGAATSAGATAAATASAPPVDQRKPFKDASWEQADGSWFRFASYQDNPKAGGMMRYANGVALPSSPRLAIELSKTSGDLDKLFGYLVEGPTGDKYCVKLNNVGRYEITRYDSAWKGLIIASGKFESKPLGAVIPTSLDWTDEGLRFSIDGVQVYTEPAPSVTKVNQILESNDLSYKPQGPLSEMPIEVRLRIVN